MSSNASSSGGGGGGGGSGGGGSGSGGGGPCGACKFLRRKCVPGCIFAPYFDSEQGAAHFAAVHKVFGASNVSKLLLHIPVHKRLDAVVTICYEAQARLRDPIYGCVAHIFALQQQVVNLQAELSFLQAHLTTLELPTPLPPPPPAVVVPPPLSIADLPSASSIPATYDLSSLFDPMAQAAWMMPQRQIDPRQFEGGGGDLNALARELLRRQGSPPPGCIDASSSPSSVSK
ncbi:LOB domain-containing protein 18 [Syzygium oleosum]|uniref:LOB domain-containing protein 18 n=1 Tax=Syzygium oleosum TaxID=219896 RepID=UPI0024BAA928|nr:LOB domain-containing protein 18 [Syzygium oleosum]